jgi:hypothetical protein
MLELNIINKQTLQEATAITKFLADYVDQLDYINDQHISSFELLDSCITDTWCEATVCVKLMDCPIPLTMSLPYITPEILVQLAFAADPIDCQDRRDARSFFAVHYLSLFIDILYGEADSVIKQAYTQMN